MISFRFPPLYLMMVLMAFLLALAACQQGALPHYGYHRVNPDTGDTMYHHIRDFAFIDQDSQVVTQDYFKGKVYVADFFFTSCPSICPKVKKQMLRVYEQYKGDERVALLSHTIDVKHDTVAKLKKYAMGLGADSPQWRFVTGNKDSIYAISYDYISTVLEDKTAPGGFDHSGWILLIDENRHIRAFADGTKEEEVSKFIPKIGRLLEEMEQEKAQK